MATDIPRLLLAAPASGSGKTTVAMGLLAALRSSGMRPAAFKCGPDYIDPMFHREVLGIPGRNLDLFFTEEDVARGLLAQGSRDAGFALLEGVMGFYDGVGGTDQASSWRLASATETPVVLVLRPRGAFLSLAALVNGFVRFREKSLIHGILLNQCGERLFAKLAPMLEKETGIRVYGHIPDLPEATMESRHLGLVTPDGVRGLRGKVAALAESMRETVDVDGLVRLAGNAPPLEATLPEIVPCAETPAAIAVARDEAFCFYYEENFDLLRSLGADLVFFSPLRDARLPDGVNGLYLGGGYPELHAGELSQNASMRKSIRAAVADGMPTLAECGGFLYLQERLAGPDGAAHSMVGALAGTGRDAGRLVRFGYLEMKSDRDFLLAPAGGAIRAHEFHRWDTDANGADCIGKKHADASEWRFGVAGPGLYAGFPHVYFWNEPNMAKRFVEATVRRSKE